MIIVFNAGSSSLKFSVYEIQEKQKLPKGVIKIKGEIENLFTSPKGWLEINDQKIILKEELLPKIPAIVDFILKKIKELTKDTQITAFAHRVVHGGQLYTQPTLITPDVIHQLTQFIPLAPLHEPYSIEVIDSCQTLHENVPQIACFDTSFHRTQPDLAQLFPLPLTFAEEGIIRYGFHGLSYQYIASKLPEYTGEKAFGRVIVAHLGNGASLCAMTKLKSVSTSMGFTALDGLMMGTRPGNIDPGILLYLLSEKKLTLDKMTDLLYKESGLKGVSGLSADMKVLLDSKEPNAKKAVDLFCYTAAKHIGSLIPTIHGLDILVFTAGIGENCPQIRHQICSYLDWLGLEIEEELNLNNAPKISSRTSKIDVYALPTNEEEMMVESVLSQYKLFKSE